MAVKNGKIVISRSGRILPIGQSTELYCYTLDGEEEPTFRRSLSVAGHTLVLDHLAFDSEGRLVLAGNRYSAIDASGMQVVRLLSNGELDGGFGQDGYSPVNGDQAAGNGLYLDDVSIRVLTLKPVNLGPYYEYMVRLKS
ncbi:hypothetical protein D3C77_575460 [compost metagenome]